MDYLVGKVTCDGYPLQWATVTPYYISGGTTHYMNDESLTTDKNGNYRCSIGVLLPWGSVVRQGVKVTRDGCSPNTGEYVKTPSSTATASVMATASTLATAPPSPASGQTTPPSPSGYTSGTTSGSTSGTTSGSTAPSGPPTSPPTGSTPSGSTKPVGPPPTGTTSGSTSGTTSGSTTQPDTPPPPDTGITSAVTINVVLTSTKRVATYESLYALGCTTLGNSTQKRGLTYRMITGGGMI